MEKKLSRFAKTDGGCIQTEFKETGGKTFFDVRKMYKKKDMDEFAPTKKGIFVPVESLYSLRKTLNKAIKLAEKAGLLEGEK